VNEQKLMVVEIMPMAIFYRDFVGWELRMKNEEFRMKNYKYVKASSG